MAARELKKRPAVPKSDHSKTNKRRKVFGNSSNKDESKGSGKAAPPKKVRLDELTWNAVQMPDKLDDYEGFFGLEEIDGVEVVKDGSGKLSFASRDTAVSNNGVNHQEQAETPQSGLKVTAAASLDEFEGFSDEDQGAPKPIIKVTEDKPAAKTKKQKAKETKPSKPKVPVAKSAFQLIEDEVEDEDSADVTAWGSLNLSPDTLAGLSKLKFTSPTPIQKAAIPDIVAGNDLIGKASTGSGKTLAFGIPIFETYLELQAQRTAARKKGVLAPLALIISPTRELAHQISQHLQDLCKGLPNARPMIATLTGGLSVQKQERQLNNADIVVGTPGRLWEVISGGRDLIERMKQARFLVLDEADRLLSQGHFQELEEILNALDRTVTNDDDENNGNEIPKSEVSQRQTLIFSATFQKELQQKLARKQKVQHKTLDKKESMEYLIERLNFRTKPRFVDVDPVRQMAANLKEGIVECGAQEKDLYLYATHLLHPTSRTLVFVNSISSVRRLVPFLQNLNLSALALHSQMPQKARLRSVERFSSPSSSSSAAILVATDVAARGLDIPSIDLVVHYHLPRASDTYIHRSGRTARAGAQGSSILLCSPDELAGTRRLIARIHVASGSASAAPAIRSLDIDRRVVARLRPRAELAKRIAGVDGAKEKTRGGASDALLREAAEDLGVEYDSEELEAAGSAGRQGRGSGRRAKRRADAQVSKDEVRSWRAQLNGLLGQRVNVGVSERYPTADVMEALMKEEKGEFLGEVQELDMDG